METATKIIFCGVIVDTMLMEVRDKRNYKNLNLFIRNLDELDKIEKAYKRC